MSLPPSPSDQTGDPSPSGGDAEVEVDLGAFLPEGVELAGADEPATGADEPGPVDPDRLARDLDAVDAAIARLDDGTYGLDPASGEPIDDALLAEDPTRTA